MAHYWDIESGRKRLQDRGTGAAPSRFRVATPRDGGLSELLRAAAHAPMFQAVIVESIDRLARMAVDSTQIERQLELLDVLLFAADEPMTGNATAILTRRLKQGVAEWYVRDLIEKSRRGMEESVRQGWHTGGRVPYGYALEEHPHPNPQKARDGKRKHRLIPDPVQAPIVREIFGDYCLRGLGLGELCEKLNSNLDSYPPPRRNRKDEMPLRQTWNRSQLWSMLHNPKYTGYNVWNRHDKRRGRPTLRPADQWVWSPAPVHEAIVTRELYELVEQRAHHNLAKARQAPASYAVRRERRPGRFYVLRGRVFCTLCGRRMEGSHQKGSNWYRCQFGSRRGAAAAQATGHPRVLGIKEDIVLAHVAAALRARGLEQERSELARATAAIATEGDRLDLAAMFQALDLAVHYDQRTHSVAVAVAVDAYELREPTDSCPGRPCVPSGQEDRRRDET